MPRKYIYIYIYTYIYIHIHKPWLINVITIYLIVIYLFKNNAQKIKPKGSKLKQENKSYFWVLQSLLSLWASHHQPLTCSRDFHCNVTVTVYLLCVLSLLWAISLSPSLCHTSPSHLPFLLYPLFSLSFSLCVSLSFHLFPSAAFLLVLYFVILSSSLSCSISLSPLLLCPYGKEKKAQFVEEGINK